MLVAAPGAHAFIPTYEPTWAKTIDYGAGLDDELVDVLAAPDGTVWACGAGCPLASAYQDLCLVRIPSNGLRAYKYRWGSDSQSEHASALVRARDGSIYTVGSATNRATGSDLVVVKWSSLGKVLWARRYDGPAHKYDVGVDIAVDRYGNVTACGRSTAQNNAPDWVVVSWTSSGTLRWKARYDRADLADWAWAMCLDSSGNAYVTGAAERAQEDTVAVTIKYSRSGKVLWRRSYSGAESLGATASSIVREPGGGVYVGGHSYDNADTGSQGSGPLVLAYSSAGVRTVLVEDPALRGAGVVNAVDVAAGSVITGGRQADATDELCPEVMRFSPAGELLTRWFWESGTWTRGTIHDVAHDASGNVFWAGHLTAQNAAINIPLIGRRSLSDAGGDWNGGWSAAASESAVPLACAVSGSALVVVGYRETEGAALDMFVLKYQP